MRRWFASLVFSFLALPFLACGEDAPSPAGSDAMVRDGAPGIDAATAPDAGAGADAAMDAGRDAEPAGDGGLGLAERLAALGAVPCEDVPEFSCATVEVPLDPEDLSGATLPFGFAVRPAADPANHLGALLLIEGGPGYSGLEAVDSLDDLDPRLGERFDLVYFDLRGVGASGGIECPAAADAWYRGGLRGATEAERDEIARRAAQFSIDCPAETGRSASELAFINTLAAAHDLEHLRTLLGFDVWSLYGLSYGTQLSQVYVTEFPEHVRAVVLDGPIDLRRTDVDYGVDVLRAVNETLTRTVTACDADPDCFAELGGAMASYDLVAMRLDLEPAQVVAPLPDGVTATRTFTRADLDDLTTATMDYEGGRSLFLRALAAASLREDYVPMRRLLDSFGGIDPYTEAILDGGYSDAVYYSVTCNDYGRPVAGAEVYLDACAAELGADARAIGGCFGEVPCATWPSAPPKSPRPPAFAPSGIPVLVINADADIATPVVQGRGVVDGMRAAGGDVREVAVAGGHHVMWGSDDCVTVAVNSFLLDPADPAVSGDLSCPVGMIDGYDALSPDQVEDYEDPEVLAVSIATELYWLPDFPGPSAWGCDRAGSLELTEDGEIALRACSFVEDVIVDGVGTWDDELEQLELELQISGTHEGSLTYVEDEVMLTITGTYNGQPVNILR